MKREEDRYKNFVPIDDKGELTKEKRKFTENIKRAREKMPLMFRKSKRRPAIAGINV